MHDHVHYTKYISNREDQIEKGILFKYAIYQIGHTQNTTVNQDLPLNILDRDLAVNHQVRLQEVGTKTNNYSHHTKNTGGMASEIS